MSIEKLELYITNADLAGLDALLTENPSLAKSHTSHHVSPLMLSCYYKKPEVTALLLKYLDFYAEDGFTPLGLACYFGQYEIARYLVLKGADVNLPSNNGFRVYPLHSAVAGNYTQIARMLIENNAQVNVKQQAGATALHSAAQNGNIDLLILLLEHGADVNIRMEGGKLPADLAREKGFVEIAEALV
jgi:ankyrin repeat protein